MKDVFVHSHGLCESRHVGRGTRVWAFAHILPGARIGEDCNICDTVFVENDVIVGDRVTIKCGVQLWDGVRLEDDVFVGPNATFTNDPFPRSRAYPEAFSFTTVRRSASIGANATILPGVEIGSGAMVGAGAVVTRDVPPNAIVVGNPAKVVGYTTSSSRPGAPEFLKVRVDEMDTSIVQLNVSTSALHRMKRVTDPRGELTVAEFARELPFAPQRFFFVSNVPSREIRGEHAHRACHQFLICISGSCKVLLDDGTNRRELTLDRPNVGVYMPPMVWGTQYNYSADAVLLVFASHEYDPDDYIRTYDEFITAVGTSGCSSLDSSASLPAAVPIPC